MKGFVSYAHQNTRMFERFNKFIKRPVASITGLEIWADSDNRTGDDFERKILDQIAEADFFILLVCADFLASDFIWDKEMPAIRGRHQSGALVLPVVLRPCLWDQVTGAHLASPRDKNNRLVPVAKWSLRDEGYNQATAQVVASIRRYFNLPPSQAGVFT